MNVEQARKVARLHLDVAHALYRVREQSGLSVDTVAERTGLTPDRIIAIEEGDTTSLTKVAQLCDAMGIDIVAVFPAPSDQKRPDVHEALSSSRLLRTG